MSALFYLRRFIIGVVSVNILPAVASGSDMTISAGIFGCEVVWPWPFMNRSSRFVKSKDLTLYYPNNIENNFGKFK
jgi:hypothetical protein